jgi:hypothetical protein
MLYVSFSYLQSVHPRHKPIPKAVASNHGTCPLMAPAGRLSTFDNRKWAHTEELHIYTQLHTATYCTIAVKPGGLMGSLQIDFLEVQIITNATVYVLFTVPSDFRCTISWTVPRSGKPRVIEIHHGQLSLVDCCGVMRIPLNHLRLLHTGGMKETLGRPKGLVLEYKE